jgi:ammonium transporter, Amt family
VHGVGGIIGAMLTGVLARTAIAKPGLIDGNAYQVVLQFYGVAATVIYCAVATTIILLVIKATIGLRVKEEVERDGLDLAMHGEVVP